MPARAAELTWRAVVTGMVLGAAGRMGVARPWGLLENNINQTAASSAAFIISAVPEDSACS